MDEKQLTTWFFEELKKEFIALKSKVRFFKVEDPTFSENDFRRNEIEEIVEDWIKSNDTLSDILAYDGSADNHLDKKLVFENNVIDFKKDLIFANGTKSNYHFINQLFN